MADITGAMTALAEATLDLRAGRRRCAEQDRRYGAPLERRRRARSTSGSSAWASSARASSMSRPTSTSSTSTRKTARPPGRSAVSAHEYFAQLARSLYTLIGETTDDGFVFRVDLALRPNGNSGPPAVSLAMLEEYFLVQGREWERFAWLKSRVVAPRASVAQRPRAGAAQHGDVVRLPPLPRLRRVRGPAPAAPQGARRGRSAAPPAAPSAPTT